ncbi:MAG: putative rane protein [Candidatus Saccharibacteria bacterium]|nr:putative rane protein [Candidatus Saccharibacteria bacterium]
MLQTFNTVFRKLLSLYSKYRIYVWAALLIVILTPVVLIALSHITIDKNSKYILSANSHQHERVGLVLGAGITKSGKPFKELQARLDVAAKALQAGQVDKLLLSGDNRQKGYNEPDAMKNYLVNVKHVAASQLQPDYAGRSTYESCERASKVFGLHQVIIYSAGTHLPRAIYLCRHFGIDAYGVSSGVEANNGKRRELLADVKAVLNVHVRGEQTILGQPIRL